MKYLDLPSFQELNARFAAIDAGNCVIHGRIEAYSCKVVGSDKKLYRNIEHQLQTEMSKSPGNDLSVSPFGPLSASASRKTFLYLIATLNAAYVDYDFSNASPEQFRKEINRHMLMNSINTTLAGVVENYNNDLRDRIWSTFEMEIDMQKADIYSYIPDLESDPFTEDGVIWSFNYFFYNRSLKRIIFFTCRAISKASASGHNLLAQMKQDEVISSSDGENAEEFEGVWEFEDDQMQVTTANANTTSTTTTPSTLTIK